MGESLPVTPVPEAQVEVVRQDSAFGRWEFVRWRPTGPLASIVEALWAVVGRANYTVERMFPRATVEVLFNLGASHRLLDPRRPSRGTDFHRAWVAGLQKECLTVESRQETRLIGIRFQPLGARLFFDAPLEDLACCVVDLDLVLGPGIETVRQRLLEARSWARRFGLLVQLVEERLVRGAELKPFLLSSMDALVRSRGALRVRALSRSLGLSEDTLTSSFRRGIGLTPKRYARMLRFHAVLGEVALASSPDWTRLAHDMGYFDQAHFIKDFRAFTGTTPSDYLKRRSADGDAVIEA